MGDKVYGNNNGRPTLQELTAAGISLVDSGGYYTSTDIESAMSEIFSRHERNYMINGNFDIWQRGTSFANPANATYTADRIRLDYDANGGTPPTIIHSRQQLTSGELDKSFYCYRINANGAGSGYGVNSYYTVGLQLIENGTRLLCGLNKKVTISFYIRSSITGRIVSLEVEQRYGSGGSPSSIECLTPLRITCNSTWTKVIYTLTTNTLSGKTFGTNNDDFLKINLWTQAGSGFNSRTGGSPISWASGNIDITQVQVNAGDTALDYVAPVPAEEELKCMRYYEKSYLRNVYAGANNYYGGYFNAGSTDANGAIRVNVLYKVPKRIVPVLTTYKLSGGSNNWGYTINGASGNNVVYKDLQGESGWSGYIHTGTSWVVCNIEGHWTADAEF